MTDIRDLLRPDHDDICRLNFIRGDPGYIFRRHHFQGLRSHVIQVLKTDDVKKEAEGIVKGGVMVFPPAVPVKVLRIFKRRFAGRKDLIEEIKRFEMVRRYLTAEHVALSEEFAVTYACGGSSSIMLCGLQEYVHGLPLDPWPDLIEGYMERLAEELACNFSGEYGKKDLEKRLHASLESFAARIKILLEKESLLPDLAGARNIVATADGRIKLVDINNISILSGGSGVVTDDFGYPVCDKSLEALLRMERFLLNKPVSTDDPPYAGFFTPERSREVAEKERLFKKRTKGL